MKNALSMRWYSKSDLLCLPKHALNHANTLLASRNNLVDIYGDAKVFDIFMLLNVSPFAVNVSLFLLMLFVSCSLTIIV